MFSGKTTLQTTADAGFWPRRIDEEHRLIYKYQDGDILIAKCRFHYD